ncbi:MAG: T9SS type A sorting domain-containing protein [Bacteroidia bacterium]|jgi:hypothetical protein|nr:T9SS type A sorting domain-containing protein [Bacteroidia bacterium]
MKKQILSLTMLFASAVVVAQTPILDSAILSQGYVNDVFYSMKNGAVATVAGNNWHIAFATRAAQPPTNTMRAATIMVNEGRNVRVYKSAQTNWSSFDTTGYAAWPNPHNSDTTWDLGALNRDYNQSNPFDYGWGEYSMTSHNIDGKGAIYLLRLTKTVTVNGQPRTVDSAFKKLTINSLIKDTQWVFTIANIDGTDSNRVTISKQNFDGKLFAYYNMVSNTVIDREPAASWEVLFTRYGTFITQFNTTIFTTTTGALTHPTVEVSEVRGIPVDSAVADLFESNINTIGTDWKINPGPGQPNFTIIDSLSYFVRAANGREDKLVFKGLTTSATGVITFEKTYTKVPTSLSSASKITNVSVYPNPATDMVYIQTELASTAQITLLDITGKEMISQQIDAANNGVSVASLPAGMYLLVVTQNNSRSVSRIVIQ